MTEKKDSPILKEIGATGTSLWGSYIVMEDEITDFQYLSNIFENYDKMRRDATVQALLSAIGYPIRALKYDIVPASSSDEDKKIAAFIKEDLFQRQSVTFDDYLREALSCLWAGFSVAEKVWVKGKDGKIHLKKLATRLQTTCDGWEFDEHGGPKGMYQLAPPKYVREFIPITKLILFSFAKEGGNIQGRSILRAGWRHFKIKDFLYKLQAIRAERDAVGVPYAQLPEGATEADAQKAQDLVTSLRMDEEGGFVYPHNWKVGLLGGQGASFPIQATIDHHDLMLAKSAQASFLNLAGMSVGSFALSKELTNLFLVSLNAVVRFFCETNDRYFIQQWVKYNWGEREKYPTLYARPLEVRDLESAARALSLLVGSALLIPDNDVLNWVRSFFYGLPPVAEPPVPVGESPGIEEEMVLAEEDRTLPIGDWGDKFLISVGDLLKEWEEFEKKEKITVELQWKFVPPDRMYREVTLPGLIKELDKLQKLYEDGKISARSLRIRTGNRLKKYGTASFAYGKALSTGVPQIDDKGRAIILPEDKPIINRYVALHRGFLSNFQNDLEVAKREGRTISLSGRAEQYALSSKNMFEAGRAAGMGFSPDLLPQVPGDMKTACGCRCGCTLRYEPAEGGVNVYWELGPTKEHCSDCVRLASTWTPLFISTSV